MFRKLGVEQPFFDDVVRPGQIIPTELLNEVDGREPPSDLNFASGQDGGDVVKFLVRQELQLKSHILSLRQGSCGHVCHVRLNNQLNV
jgi:hypothetical protein